MTHHPDSPRHPRRHRRPRTRLAALAAVTALLATGGSLAATDTLGSGTAAAAPRPTAEGARITGVKQVAPRTFDLTVASAAVGKQLPVRVILPARFDAQPERKWPVLYLLQGAHDDYTSWTRETDVEEFLADQDVLTVMPSSGATGIPTDWWEWGRPGAPDYETFQVEELMGLLQREYRAGDRRAVAGVSTGGYGALAFASRHPGTFGAAASYSGILDTTALGMVSVVHAIVARELLLPVSLWGVPLLHRENWRQHNPYALAEKLAGTGLYLSQGSGVPSSDFGNLQIDILEGTLRAQAGGFKARLDRLGIPAQTHFYSGGTHAWPNWQQEFKASWPVLAKGLGLL
ncbi:alpha/beta hydrolase [Streptomyces monticola]|uniref:Alpha/beta hydrolase n=1 Tax=Streptomyces monticola TaxID=2666263 RepID=A0ABW2JAL9_9ACTN